MKKIFAIIICVVCCSIVAAQPQYTLDQILDSARQNNIAIRSAKHKIESAQQLRKEAFTKYFPSISAAGVWFNASKDMAQMTLNPAEMMSPPALRPAVVIMLAMLAAPGRSTLRNVYSIARGYENFAKRLKSLGADIEPLAGI